MKIFLDSASLEEIRTAARFDFVAGVTSNPTLLLRAISARKGESKEGILGHLEKMAQAIGDKLIFSQVPTKSAAEMYEYGKRFARVAPERFVVKLPCNADGIEAAKRLQSEGIKTCITAVFSAAQGVAACGENVDYVAPYLGRFTRSGGDGFELVAELAGIIKAMGSGTEVIAASIQSPREATRALLAGAHNVTVPYPVLAAWFGHAMTSQALEQFNRDWDAVVEMVGE